MITREQFYENSVKPLLKEHIVFLDEIFDAIPTNVSWEKQGNTEFGYFNIDGTKYAVVIDIILTQTDLPYQIWHIGFGHVNDKGDIEYSLQNWRSSPSKVLGGVLYMLNQKFSQRDPDVLVLGASEKFGEAKKRMQLYQAIAVRYQKQFVAANYSLKTREGDSIIVLYSKDLNPENKKEIYEILQKLEMK